MPVRIRNKRPVYQVLPIPVDYTLRPNEEKFFRFVEFDEIKNDEIFVDLESQGFIEIFPVLDYVEYVSEWNRENKLRLGDYTFWIDASNALRMKMGDPNSDTDGAIIGPGGTPSPHGNTHTFDGIDPIPNIESLENLWNCPTTVSVGSVVYQSGISAVDRAVANSPSTMPAIGIVISKPTTTTCIIVRSGEVNVLSGLTPDRRYYVSASIPGGLTTTPPNGAGNIVQGVGYSKASNIFTVQIGETRRRA